jgi:hypothetical protein
MRIASSKGECAVAETQDLLDTTVTYYLSVAAVVDVSFLPDLSLSKSTRRI